LRHPKVHDNQVRWIGRNQIQHLMAVLSLTDTRVPKHRHEQGNHALPDGVVVVGNDRVS